MIWLTGDTHGELARFRHGRLRWLGKKDTLIVLGDFGFLWSDSRAERAARRWLTRRRYTLLFLDGCHENFDLLAQYPQEEKFGGTVRALGGNLYYVERGSILEIEGKKLFCFGGGETRDREDREEGVNWWPAEVPTQQEMQRGREHLAAAGNTVDYILTHDAPVRLMDFAGIGEAELSDLNRYFDGLLRGITYKKWFFGRYHRDLAVSPRAACVFCEPVALRDE